MIDCCNLRYFRDNTTSTNQKQLKAGTATLTGQRPAVFEDALGWMDSNMSAACKATVRAEKKRAVQRPQSTAAATEQQDSGAGASSDDRDPTMPLELSGSGRHRKAPERLDPIAAAARSHGGRRKSSTASSASKQATALRAEKLRWKAERKMRERTRQLLLQELWKTVQQPEEGERLVGWMVEAVGVDQSDELASGTIVGYTPPDSYVVEWTDATTTT